MIDNASSLFQQNKGYWPSEFCNDTDIAVDANRNNNDNSAIHTMKCGVSDKPKYRIICNVDYDETDTGGVIENVNLHIDWGGQSKTPLKSYPAELLKQVAARLYIGSPNIGGKVTCESLVYGFTDIYQNGHIYRCRPFYGNTGSWYDWAYFDWDGFDFLIPARILMIIDLSHSTINYDVDIDPDEFSVIAENIKTMIHLTKSKWVVVKAAKNPCIPPSELTDDHIHVDMITRIKLDEECIWLVPLSLLVKPYFVIYNKNYKEILNYNG